MIGMDAKAGVVTRAATLSFYHSEVSSQRALSGTSSDAVKLQLPKPGRAGSQRAVTVCVKLHTSQPFRRSP